MSERTDLQPDPEQAVRTEEATAYFAAGCFWGVEAVFSQRAGVTQTTVGYMNGETENPTYEEVCYRQTGHVEAVEVRYNPAEIHYAELCRLFWRLHDPTP